MHLVRQQDTSARANKKETAFKMKFFIVLAIVFAVAAAAPANLNNPDASATIVEQNADIDPQGNFQYS